MDKIIIKGARENNLKNIDIEIPKNKFVVMTGVSGSGKSSLAFDTIYQEGQRRFVESLSSYARQFLGNNEKPDVDSIEGLSPSISIDQKSVGHNPRSTVGTVTEIYDYLRLLFARVGVAKCPTHKEEIKKYTIDEIILLIDKYENDSRLEILSPIVSRKKGEFKDLFQKYKKEGFLRVYVDSKLFLLENDIKLDKNKFHNISLVIDRILKDDESRTRIAEAINLASSISGGFVEVKVEDEIKLYSTEFACVKCGYTISKLEPRCFSFNSPLGACPECNGLGYKERINKELIVDYNKSINDGCIIPFKNADVDNLANSELIQTCKFYNIDLNKRFCDLKDTEKNIILYGSNDLINYHLISSSGRITNKTQYYEGIINIYERRYRETNSDWIRDWISNFMTEQLCDKCLGHRLNESYLNVFINDFNIASLCDLSISKLKEFFINIKLSEEEKVISRLVIKEILDRLSFLEDVGLEYLSLNRRANTLSGGEAQRIRLATQIGSQLTGVLYVLDEPSIGLHQKDNDKLIDTLKKMRDLGNSLIVVEHDLDTMKSCDYLIDIGPFAGINGGKIVSCGTPLEVMSDNNSLTGKYLSKKLKIDIFPKRKYDLNKSLIINDAYENNLKHITCHIPLHVLTIVSGVSGSGKSSLVNQVLLKNLEYSLTKNKKIIPGHVGSIEGIDMIEKVIEINQQPIGRTPRSNPATYTQVFDFIRDLFSQTNEAKIRGFDKSKFSFNVKGGRCEACCGDGVKKISMHFLPDVYVQCEVCKGKRYQKEVLDILYKGKNISDVLDMQIEEAYNFFKDIPRIEQRLNTLLKVGLGYLKLGQSSTTLSGGEAQRIKLASELSTKINPNSIYILDEPTTGLHSHDVLHLINVLQEIVSKGASMVIIEHNLDVIKQADYIIDLGLDGGYNGGNLLYEGDIYNFLDKESYTAKYLKKEMEDL